MVMKLQPWLWMIVFAHGYMVCDYVMRRLCMRQKFFVYGLWYRKVFMQLFSLVMTGFFGVVVYVMHVAFHKGPVPYVGCFLVVRALALWGCLFYTRVQHAQRKNIMLWLVGTVIGSGIIMAHESALGKVLAPFFLIVPYMDGVLSSSFPKWASNIQRVLPMYYAGGAWLWVTMYGLHPSVGIVYSIVGASLYHFFPVHMSWKDMVRWGSILSGVGGALTLFSVFVRVGIRWLA